MKEREAEQKGYRFTGSYERSKEEIKERAEEYKKEGYKVIICTVPDSPLSRGGVGTGYSIYAEPKYFIDKEIKDINNRLSRIDKRKQDALEKYNKEIEDIENDKRRLEERLKEIEV
jgi:DNA repair exonuclease SbcCD ATPase subunit